MLLTGMKDVYHLPCAGITLIRFYGFYLSSGNFAGHPGETLKFFHKTKDNFFSQQCNLSTLPFV